jgi:hypothetical protein
MVEIPKDSIPTLYASLMSEVKCRLSSVEDNLRALPKFKNDQIHQTFALEFCYFQLRRITELVSIAILGAHNVAGPSFRTKDFLRSWNAEDLMKQLAKLNIEAFPQRSYFFEPKDDPKVVHLLLPTKPSYEARDEIWRIYVEASDKLHTGGLKLVLKQRNKPYSVPFVRGALTSLVQMLNNHVLQLPNGQRMQAKLQLQQPGPVFCRWMGQEPLVVDLEPPNG